MNYNTPKVSIVVPSLNSISYIRECIDSILKIKANNNFRRNHANFYDMFYTFSGNCRCLLYTKI